MMKTTRKRHLFILLTVLQTATVFSIFSPDSSYYPYNDDHYNQYNLTGKRSLTIFFFF